MGTRAQQGYVKPLVAAIAANATTPNPGITNAIVLSSTTGTFLRWTGTLWASMSTLTATQVEIDVGTTPVPDFDAVVTDAAASTGSKVFATVSWDAPTGKDADDVSMDTYVVNADAGAGSITFRIAAHEGWLEGTYKIDYLIAG